MNLRRAITRVRRFFRRGRKHAEPGDRAGTSGRNQRGEPPPAPAGAPGPRAEPALSAITELGRAPERTLPAALAELRQARGTASERAALQAVVALRDERRAPDPMLVAAAEVFVQRGELDRALALLDGIDHASALLVAADIRAERGELAHALAMVERVLARDIDFAGARERQRRWAVQLGPPATAPDALQQPTLLVSDAPQTGLRIVGEAGRGGAGTVYEAVDDLLGRRVALKVYHRRVEERSKLEREARIAVALAGPGVVRVFDADAERGFLVMEWVLGGALKAWLRRADLGLLLPLERWFVPLVRAVARVHVSGVVHADLKPANVLFRAPDQPIVSDFGLARPSGERAGGGSLGYMSPERLSEKSLSFADDVYALGRILEDTLEIVRTGAALDAVARVRWQAVAQAALAEVGDRPTDAAALLEALRYAGLAPRLTGAAGAP